MIEPGAVLEADKLGVRIEVRETAASTDGAYVEFESEYPEDLTAALEQVRGWD